MRYDIFWLCCARLTHADYIETFRFKAQNLHSYLSFPPTSTLGNFVTDSARHVGTLKKLDVKGAYRYFTEVKDGNVEGVDLDVEVCCSASYVNAYFDLLVLVRID